MPITKEPLDGDDVFLLHGFCSADECDQYIELSERCGYHEATIPTNAGRVVDKDIRDNTRLVLNDATLAAEWFRRAEPWLPKSIDDWTLHGFSDKFRFYRYDPGQKFAPHYDGSTRRLTFEQSFISFMVYLNDGFGGGETKFYLPTGECVLSVSPTQGTALAFLHRRLHEGAEVTSGRKYVLRTDVMYKRGK